MKKSNLTRQVRPLVLLTFLPLLVLLSASAPVFSATWAETQKADWSDGLVNATTWYPQTQLQLDWHGSTTGAIVPSTISWMSGWDYRKAITINNASGGALSDYQVLVTSPVFDETGLVGSWHLDGGTSGSIANGATAGLQDTSGNSNNGTASNANGTGMAWAVGKASGAVSFDGVDDYVQATSAFGDVDFKNTNFSVELWLNRAVTTEQRSFYLGTVTGTNYGFEIGTDNTATQVWINWHRSDANATGRAAILGNTTIAVGNWYHIVVTHTAGEPSTANTQIYVNGSSVTTSGPVPYGHGPYVMSNIVRISGDFNGNIDEPRVYNRALSASEIKAHYQAKIKPNYDDIRFTKSDGTTSLPYWMESDGKFWIKVSGANSIPAGNSTIYAYYGSSSAVTASSGPATFDFFDDFNRADGTLGNNWVTVSGNASISGNRALIGDSASLDGAAHNPANGAVNAMGVVSDFQLITQAQNYGGVMVRSTNAGNFVNYGYGWILSNNANLYIYDGGSLVTGPVAFSVTLDTLYNQETLVFPDNSMEVRIWQKGTARPSSPSISKSAFSPSVNDGTGIRIIGAGNLNVNHAYYDDIRVRKYSSTEPVSSMGSEEGAYFSTGTYKSNVLDAGADNAFVTSVAWNPSGQPGGTTVALAARASNTIFAVGDSTPAWTAVTNGGNPGVYGRYIQYMSTFTTADVSTSSRIEDITLTYGFLNAPSGLSGTADSPSQITWNWTDNSSNPQETGFKIYDQGSSLKGTVGSNVVSWAESSGLSPNTQYTRYVQAYLGSVMSNSGNVSLYTLPVAPTSGNVPCDKSVSTPYNTPFFTFTNNSGFGAGGVQYFKYKWDANSSETTFPDTWSGGDLTLSLSVPGTYYYLHLKAYNGDGTANPTTLTKGPYVSGIYLGAADTDETSGQFGGGLVKSSVTVAGTGNAAVVGISTGAGAGSYVVGGSNGWIYRKAITINNAGGSALSDYQVLVTSPVYDESGLTGSWHFEEGAGNTTADSSGNGNTGTITIGGGGSQTTVAQAWANGNPGKFGRGLSFDGTDDYVSISSNIDLKGPEGRTISMWVKHTNTFQAGSPATTVLKKFQAAVENVIVSFTGATGKLDFYADGGSTASNLASWVAGQWYYVAVVYDATGAKIYINGNLDNSSGNGYGAGESVSAVTYIGAAPGDGQYFNGSIDEPRVYNRALSAAEIQARYQAKAKLNYDDIRFTKADGTTLLPHWMEADGKFWVKVSGANSIPVGNSTIYAYYGSSTAASVSDGASTFDFFDDFNGGSIDTSKWTIQGANPPVQSGGLLRIDEIYKDRGVYSNAVFNSPLVMEHKRRSNNDRAFSYSGLDDGVIDNTQTGEIKVARDRSAGQLGVYVGDAVAQYWSDDSNFHEIKMAWNGNAQSLYYDKANVKNFTETIAANRRIHFFNTYDLTPYPSFDIDWVRVRKYSSTEPVSSMGSEDPAIGYFPAGEFQSRVMDSGGSGRHWGDMGWRHISPSGTSIQIRARTGNTATPDGSWSSWYPLSGFYTASTGTALTVPDGRYLQYASTFTTSVSTATPILDEVTATYGWLNAPTGFSGTADSPSQITWNWTDNSSAPQNEDGFKIYDQGSSLKGTVGVNAVSWVESSGLSPNTQYTRYAQAYAPGLTANSGNASRYTLAVTPTGANITCDKSVSVPYNAPFFTFTNTSGFGTGTVQYFKYKWDTNPSETTFPDTWSGGDLTLSLTAPGTYYYLHLKAYNAEDAGNPTTLTKGPYVSGIYYGAMDADETSGQFGGGLVKSSVTVNGTGNAAYLGLSSINTFPVDGAYGWKWRREINITNAGTYGLTNYQVFIPTTSFGANWTAIRSSAQPTMADFRFTMSTSTVSIPYWIDSDTTAPKGFWVKVSSIPTAGTKIHMYYGNSPAVGASNGPATFDFFDDFSDNDYTTNPTWTASDGSWTAANKYLTSNVHAQSISTPFTSSIGAWEFSARWADVSGPTPWPRFIFRFITDSSGTVANNYYQFGAYQPGEGGGTDVSRRKDGGSVTYVITSATTISDINWHNIKITKDNSGTIKAFVDGGVIGTYTDATPITASAYMSIFTQTGEETDYDNVRVRQYTSTEPAVGSIGSEEQAGYFLSGEFQSRVMDGGGSGRHWGDMGWRHVSPSGTSIQMRARTGNTATPDGSWSSWYPLSGFYTASTGTALTVPDGRYLQYASTFTTSVSTATPILDEVTATYGWLNAPTGFSGTADSPSQITWSWTDNSAAPQNEDGFKIYDQGSSLKGTAGQNAVSWIESSGLSPNTQYTRYVQAYAPNITANSGNVSRYTLAVTPTGANITCDKAISTPYNSPFFTFTNTSGFGTGAVQYVKYKWDTNPSETTFDDTWSTGTLALSGLAYGTSYYLHIKSYNAEDAANPTTLTKGPYVSGVYLGARDTDETSGQFGGGLVKSSVTVSGTGNAAYMQLTGSGTFYSVDGASGWNFRREINISNAGTYGLADYQVFIPTTSFGGSWSAIRFSAQVTMADFRFTMSTSTVSIPYWIDSDTTSPKGFWVKVSSIPTTGAKIYMYYGNSSAVAAGNGTTTFEFFDDFENGLGKWTLTGSPAIVGGRLKLSACDDEATSPSTLVQGAWQFDYQWNDYGDYKAWQAFFTYKDSSNYYVLDHGSNNLGQEFSYLNKNVAGTNVSMSNSGPRVIDTSHNYTKKITNDINGSKTVYQDNIVTNTGTDNSIVSSASLKFRDGYMDNPQSLSICTHAAPTMYFDNVRVRKYASAEPSIASIGAEELSGYSPSGEFQSRAIDTTTKGSRWGNIAWSHVTPQDTTIKLRVRTGDTSVPDGTWSAWEPAGSWHMVSTGSAIGAPRAQYIQYQSSFTTLYSTVSPQLSDVTIWYATNTTLAPSLISPASGVWIATAQPVFAWNFGDPESDLQTGYRVEVATYPNYSATAPHAFTGAIAHDSGDVSSSTQSYQPGSGIGNGTYYWHVKTSDTYGAWSVYSSTWQIKLDTSAPAGHSVTSVVPQISSCAVNIAVPTDVFSGLNALPYSVRYSTSNLFEAEVSTVSGWFAGASTIVLSMQPATTYYFAVRARDAVNNESWSSYYAKAMLADPPGLSVNPYTIYASSAVVRWDQKNNAVYTQYRAQRSAKDDAVFSVVEDDSNWKTGISSWTFSTLEVNSTYYFRVKARNPAGQEAPSGPAWVNLYSTQTLVNPPLANAPDVFVTSITARWDVNNAPGTPFLAEISATGDFSSISSSSGWQNDISSCPFTGLVPNTNYFARVRARNSSSVETFSVPLYSEYTRAELPGGNITPYTRTGSEITVNWSQSGNPSPDTEYFAVRSSTQDFSAGTDVSGWVANNSRQFTGLAPGTTYYFRVKARNRNAVPLETDWKVLASSVTSPAPATPTNLTLGYPDAVSTDRLTLNWSDNSSTELGFRIYESTDGAAYSLKDTAANNITNYLSVSLSTNTLYYYKVAAYNANGESYTNAASTYTRAYQPTAQAISDVGVNSLKANWGANNNPSRTNFICEISTQPGFSPLWASSQTLLTNALFLNLQANATYYARVKAVNGSGAGTNYTDLGSARTLPLIMTLGVADMAPGGVTQGQSVPYAKITVTPSGNNAAWSGLVISRTGTGSDQDVARVSLRRDGNSNGAFEAGNDPEAGWGVFASSAVTISLNETLSSAATYFVVLIVADNYLSWPGNSIGISIASTASFISANSEFTMSPASFSSGPGSISKLADTLSVIPTSVAPVPNVSRGQANTAFLKLVLTAARDRAYLRSLIVQKTGTLADNYVNFIKVYLDTNQNGQLNAGGGDTLISSGVDIFSSSQAVVQLVNPSTRAVVNETYFIALDIDAAAPLGNTVGVRVANSGAFGLMAGTPDSVNLTVTPGDSTLPMIVDPPNILIVTPAAMGVTTLEQGETAALERLEFVTNSGNAVISGLKVQRSSYSTDGDYGMIALYRDNNPFGSFSAASDSLVSSGAFTAGQFTFPISETITFTSTKAYFVVAGISPSANTADKAGVLVQSGYITPASGQTTVNAPVPFASALAQINYTIDTVIVTPDASVSPGSVYQGASGVPLLKLGVKTDKNAADMAGVTLNQIGSAGDSDISSLRIYKDNGDGIFSAAQDAAVTGGYAFSGGTVTVSFSSIQTVTVSSGIYFIAADIAGTAVPGRTAQLRLSDSSYFSVLAPDLLTSTFPIVSNVVNIEKFPATVLVSSVSLAPASAQAGTADIPMIRLTVRTNQSTAEMTSLSVMRQGGADSYVGGVKLFWDSNSNGTADANEMTSSAAFTGGVLSLPVSGQAKNLSATPRDYIVTMSISSSAAIGASISAGFTGITITSPDSVEAGRLPFASGSVQVAEPPSQLSAVFESKISSWVTQGDSAVLVASLTLRASAYSVNWTRLDVLRTGTGADADISSLKIYADNGNGTWGGVTEENFIASGTFSSNQASVNFSPQNIAWPSAKTYYIAADISNIASAGGAFGINLPAASYLGAQSPDTVSSAGLPFNSSQAAINATVDTLVVDWSDLSPSVKQGDAAKALGKLTLRSSANSASLTEIKFNKTGTAADSDISGIQVYRDNGDGIFGAGDIPVGQTSGLTNGLAVIMLSPAQEITTTAGDYFVTAGFPPLAAIGTTFGLAAGVNGFKVVSPDLVSVTGSTASFTAAGTIGDSSDTVRVSFYDMAPTSLYQGRSDNIMAKLRFQTLQDQAVLTGIKVGLAGTAALTDLGTARIYADSNADGSFDPAADTPAGSGNFASSVLTITLNSAQLITTTPKDFFVILDVAAGASIGNTAGFNFANAGYFMLSGADGVEAFSPAATVISVIRDPKVPTPPAVNPVKADGTIAVGAVAYNAYETRLRFQWNCNVYEGSIEQAYYSIGPSPASSTSAWTSIGVKNDITITGLNLAHGATYYVSVRVKNSLGDYLSDIVSRKFIVDTFKPVIPSGISVKEEGDDAVVSWPEASVGPSGLVYYQVEERRGNSPEWTVISTTTEKTLSVTRSGLGVSALEKPAGTYYYRVRAVNGAGVPGDASQPVTVNLGLGTLPALSMVSVYPNPFDSRKRSATINFTLNQASSIDVTVYDIFGSKVKGISMAGAAGSNDIPWDGTDDSGQKVSKGVYICVVKAAGDQKTIKVGVIH